LNFKESFGNVVDPYFAWCYKSHSISLCLIIAKKIQNGDQPSPLHRIDACVHVRRIIGKLVNKETKAIWIIWILIMTVTVENFDVVMSVEKIVVKDDC
jgi:hypothetical protein